MVNGLVLSWHRQIYKTQDSRQQEESMAGRKRILSPGSVIKKLNLSIFIILLIFSSARSQNGFRVYGFFDLEMKYMDLAPKNWTFDQNHLNVISIYSLDDHFTFINEMEWQHDSDHSADMGRSLEWERAFVEYKYSDALRIIAGKFLSPFGLYNERHSATPSIISTFLPIIYRDHEHWHSNAGKTFSKYSTGVGVLGSIYSGSWEGKYHLYLSNGRGPQQDQSDNNVDKGMGTRLTLAPPGAFLKLGFSAYRDRNGNDGNSRQRAIGFDIELDLDDLHMEGEAIRNHFEELDINGIPDGVFTSGGGYYILGNYVLFDSIKPFARYEYYDENRKMNNDAISIYTCGINISVTPKVILKGETHFHRFQMDSMRDFEMYVSSLAVAF